MYIVRLTDFEGRQQEPGDPELGNDGHVLD